jgi:hypothetical protein
MKKEEKFLKLITEKIKTEDQKNKFIELMNRDVEKFSESIIDTYKMEVDNKFKNIHNPDKILNILKLFGQENILKYISHSIEYTSYSDYSLAQFLEELDNFKIEKMTIATICYELNYNAYSLFKNAIYKEDEENNYKWKFMDEEVETSFRYIGNKEDRLKNILNQRVSKEKKYHKLKITHKKDLFQKLFANSIRFRNDLMTLKDFIEYVFRPKEEEKDIFEFELDFNDFNDQIDITTVTNCVYDALNFIRDNYIIKNVKESETNLPIIFGNKNIYTIIIKLNLTNENDFNKLELIHIGSNPQKKIDLTNPQDFIKGNTSSLVSVLMNICDFSFSFDQSDKSYELSILKKGETKFEQNGKNCQHKNPTCFKTTHYM